MSLEQTRQRFGFVVLVAAQWIGNAGAVDDAVRVASEAQPPRQEARAVRYGIPQPIRGNDTNEHEGLFAREGVLSNSLAIPNDLSLQKGGLADKVPPAKRVGDWLVYFFVGFAVLVAPVNQTTPS